MKDLSPLLSDSKFKIPKPGGTINRFDPGRTLGFFWPPGFLPSHHS